MSDTTRMQTASFASLLHGVPDPDQGPEGDGGNGAGGAPERVIVRFRSHGRKLFFPSLFFIAVCGATGYFAGYFPEEWQNLAVLGGGALLVLLLWIIPLVSWLTHRYVLTTRRIILRHGLFVNTRQELLLSRAAEASVRKSGLQSMFRSGDVLIGTGEGHQVAVLKDVPRADLVLTVVTDLIEAATPRFTRPPGPFI
jgi:uncharacterized membrane protein YdbT with pleckstrin-like domain